MERLIDPDYLNANQGVLALLIFLFGMAVTVVSIVVKYY